MSLRAILDSIRQAGKQQIAQIESEAEAKAQTLWDVGRAEAAAIREAARADFAAPAAEERARILHHAWLEALRAVGDVQEALVDEALLQARGHLAGMRTDLSYPEVLRRLTVEALSELRTSLDSGERAILEADPRDREVIEKILGDLGLEVEVSYPLSCWGGVVAKSEDNKIVVTNTLEARLERGNPYLRRYMAAFFDHPEEVLEHNSVQVV